MRTTATVAAALLSMVLAAGLVAASAVEEAPNATGRLSLSQLSGAQSADAEPSDGSTAPATDDATPPSESSAGSIGAPPLPGHRTPGAVVTPFTAGRYEWSGVSNGISLRLVLSTPSPRAGEPVSFLAEASMPGALCCNLTLQFGDGSEGTYPPGPGLGEQARCSTQEPTSSSVRGEIRHVYNKGGRWRFSLSARSGAICGPSDVVYGSLEGELAIGGGSAPPTPQGPALPKVRPASIHPYQPLVVTLSAEAQDDDGHIDRLVVDWGDGSPTETYRNPQPCKTTASGWPGGSYTILPLWMGVGAVTHRYRDDRPHTITVTAVSTGCDRTGEQRASGTLTFPEPLPPPPSFESIPPPPPPPLGSSPPPISSIQAPPPGPLPTPQLTTTSTSAPAGP